ncbi:substrate binding domain-containing protein, partial [Pseudomonas aeruginosa]
ICASPSYLHLHGTPQTGAELIKHNCLLYGREGQYGWKLNTGSSLSTFAVQGNLSSNNGEVIREAAKKGRGIALLPLFIVEEALQQGALIQILPNYSPPPLTI